MTDKTTNTIHRYLLPDGSIATDMKTARIKMGLGAQGVRALIRKGIVKKIQITSKTSGYEGRISDNRYTA